MRLFASFTVACFVLGLEMGCSSRTSSGTTTPAQHGGSVFALSNGGGFVEILVKGQGEPRGRRRQSRQVQYAAYFYQADGTTPMDPAPTEVQLKIGTSDKATVVHFQPAGTSKPATPGALLSDSGTYPDGFQGELGAKVNGESVTARILIR